jgi:hypothetical protein
VFEQVVESTIVEFRPLDEERSNGVPDGLHLYSESDSDEIKNIEIDVDEEFGFNMD